nr:hypothetical protein Iba_chr10fCG6270 [Ipomoea batatas]
MSGLVSLKKWLFGQSSLCFICVAHGNLTNEQLKKKSRKSEAKEITIYTQVESREEGGSDWTLDTESLTGVSLEEAEAAVRLEKTRVELSPIDFSVSSSEA